MDTRVELLGERLAFPILLAPTPFQKAIHPDGERATAKGAAAADTIFVVSSSSTIRLEDVTETPNGKWWFQL
ncbi:alpha-hydroxy-acid oxidizing protein [bacterium]|nr:alpha-hydroxy-acid oxidizing protein [Verrucomicrobiales bacterium]MDA7525860.1 alpha-hydroxy-acid oxidizing protein [Verrucomicrobiales bacterium]MDC3255613.1 alpha-hydroxy-acid oxidizing protein [bacterium]MDF1789755.1 alpha-hydroxy-acid oxidizing protein [Verrucomicrobiales bacterium]